MTLNGSQRPNVAQVLEGLKDFQRQTVEYVFRRLYLDDDRTSRFLIADEVGLGKTLVARGVIAKAVDHLWDTVGRIDVVYVCSNLDIAQQNIDRLNITAGRHFQFASRATLLPIRLQELRGNKLNFVSLTPGTSLDLRSQCGWMPERAVLYVLLRRCWQGSEAELRNILRGRARADRWKAYLDWFVRDPGSRPDPELSAAFYRELERTPEIRTRYEEMAAQIGSRRTHLSDEERGKRNRLVGDLRRLLARSSLGALEPDLVILDEFQRFKYLLEDEGEVALIAQELFQFPNVKVLLLSATPYKMYTLAGEVQENHYEDFYRTVRFLLGTNSADLEQLRAAIERYRHALLRVEGALGQAQTAKAEIERILRRVMVRTERLAASADRNGMLTEALYGQDQVRPSDLAGFVHLDRIAAEIEAGDLVEFWKSAAYPLNLMDERYELKRRFSAALAGPEGRELAPLLVGACSSLLDWRRIEQYQEIDPGNARLRALWRDSVATGNWQLLWMPASLPYWQPEGPFGGVPQQGCTKTLVFSAWRVVPKSIALLLSYEAERRMLEDKSRDFDYPELTKKRKPLLTFTRSQDRLTGMPVFCLAYPCLTLAKVIDPLRVASHLAGPGLPSHRAVLDATHKEISELLRRACTAMDIPTRGRADERWYWAALALLDRHFYHAELSAWRDTNDEQHAWARMLDKASDEDDGVDESQRYIEHTAEFWQSFGEPGGLGMQPDDLVEVLAQIALCSPAVSALRAMLRIGQPQRLEEWPAFLAAAARTGLGFRTLFNQPDVISLLQSRYPEGAYWQKVLTYSLDGNLQSVLDEYFHVLYESLGLLGHDPGRGVTKLSSEVRRALGLIAPRLHFDQILLQGECPGLNKDPWIRCRYALRFGDDTTAEYEGRMRDVDVRVAFNSPFRPFVLATTAIGQEGLDFHQYCHRVVHWNLPSNPVDLEQREGRIHRYKGHVVRRNLALDYGLAAVDANRTPLNPWEQLFAMARDARPDGSSDLVPYWIYEGRGAPEAGQSFRIERKVPVLPLSREIGRIERLRRSLVAYRSVIGQPRQQELLEFLSAHLGPEEIEQFVEDATIDLSPPR